MKYIITKGGWSSMDWKKKVDGYSVLRLSVILAVFVYLDMVTTFIGYNLGMHEINRFLNLLLEINPYCIFLYPLLVLSLVFLFYKLFEKWTFEIKITYLFLSFNFAFAGATNIMGMFL